MESGGRTATATTPWQLPTVAALRRWDRTLAAAASRAGDAASQHMSACAAYAREQYALLTTGRLPSVSAALVSNDPAHSVPVPATASTILASNGEGVEPPIAPLQPPPPLQPPLAPPLAPTPLLTLPEALPPDPATAAPHTPPTRTRLHASPAGASVVARMGRRDRNASGQREPARAERAPKRSSHAETAASTAPPMGRPLKRTGGLADGRLTVRGGSVGSTWPGTWHGDVEG